MTRSFQILTIFRAFHFWSKYVFEYFTSPNPLMCVIGVVMSNNLWLLHTTLAIIPISLHWVCCRCDLRNQGTYNLDCRPHADPYRISPAKEITVDQASGRWLRIVHMSFVVPFFVGFWSCFEGQLHAVWLSTEWDCCKHGELKGLPLR